MNLKIKTRIERDRVYKFLFTIMFASLLIVANQASCFATTVTLQWDANTDTDLAGYKVYYQADSSTPQPFQGAGATPTIVLKPATTATISGLDSAHAYYFAVTAYNTAGVESAYSNIVSIPALQALATPTLISPSGAVATNTPTFTWNSVASATSYTLYRDDTKTSTLYNASTLGCSAGPPAICSITPATAIPAGSIVGWIVNATNTAGSSPWTTPNYIIYSGPVPAAPTLVSPSGAVATNTPTFTWNSVANATGYTLYRDDTKTSTLYNASTLGCSAGPPAICSITPATAIPAGSIVGWIVNATNTAGSSPWTAPNYIIYSGPVPAAPTLVSPSGAIATPTPKFTWNSVANATSYTLYRDDTKTSTLYNASTLGCSAGPPATCSITPATVIPTGSIVGWIVNATNTAGSSPWTAPNYIIYSGPVPAAPTLVSPSGAVATNTPTFTWNSVANASGYTLYRDDTKTSTLYDASALGCSAGPPAICSITPATAIPAGSTVGWIVNATNTAGSSPWTTPNFFSVP